MNSKNSEKAKAKLRRVHFDMNLGERIHKDQIHPSREERKLADRKLIERSIADADEECEYF